MLLTVGMAIVIAVAVAVAAVYEKKTRKDVESVRERILNTVELNIISEVLIHKFSKDHVTIMLDRLNIGYTIANYLPVGAKKNKLLIKIYPKDFNPI